MAVVVVVVEVVVIMTTMIIKVLHTHLLLQLDRRSRPRTAPACATTPPLRWQIATSGQVLCLQRLLYAAA